jgi:hypothetical protein
MGDQLQQLALAVGPRTLAADGAAFLDDVMAPTSLCAEVLARMHGRRQERDRAADWRKIRLRTWGISRRSVPPTRAKFGYRRMTSASIEPCRGPASNLDLRSAIARDQLKDDIQRLSRARTIPPPTTHTSRKL